MKAEENETMIFWSNIPWALLFVVGYYGPQRQAKTISVTLLNVNKIKGKR